MKTFTYQEYLKITGIKDKIIIKAHNELKLIVNGIRVKENNNLGMLCLREDKEEYNIGQVDIENTEKNIVVKKQINHPHDKIFRTVLEDKKQVIKLINEVLKLSRKLTESEIEIYNSSYISERFENKESDIVYKMKEKNIFFLIEHQSKIDYEMPMRVLNYEIEIMRQALGNRKIAKNSKIPMIIPIVIYTGRRKWNVALKIEEYQEILQDYKIKALGEYNLIDINDYSIEELEKNETFLAKLMIIEKSESKEELIKNLTKIVEGEKVTENARLLYRIINYVLREKLGNEMTKELLKKLKGGNENMGLAVMEMLEEEERELKKRIRKSCREAEQRGIEQGKSEGISIGKVEVAKEMLKNNIEDAIIIKVTQIEDNQLDKIKEEISKEKITKQGK